MSRRVLADMADTTEQTIYRLETGKLRMIFDWAHRLARYLSVDAVDLMADPAPLVPIVGKVGAGARVFPIDDHAMGDGLEMVPCPRGLNPDTTVAVLVDGDSMPPMESGWVLFYSRQHEAPGFDVIGHLCVVKVANDGPTLVKQVRRGYSPGRFNLISTNGAPIEDVELEWAARVRSALSPDEARAT